MALPKSPFLLSNRKRICNQPELFDLRKLPVGCELFFISVLKMLRAKKPPGKGGDFKIFYQNLKESEREMKFFLHMLEYTYWTNIVVKSPLKI